MMLWLTITDDWLGCEGVVFCCFSVIRLFSSYEICVVSGELLLERSFVKGGVCWGRLGNMRAS